MGASKIGDRGVCDSCFKHGTVVAASGAHDPELERVADLALEPSSYLRDGFTCRACETVLFRSALPERGVCGYCGKTNARAMHHDLGATRSFCDERCISAFLNDEARLMTERGRQAKVIGRVLAVALFKDMADPEKRGPDVTWDRLPALAESRARSETPRYVGWQISGAQLDMAASAAREEMVTLQTAGRPW